MPQILNVLNAQVSSWHDTTHDTLTYGKKNMVNVRP